MTLAQFGRLAWESVRARRIEAGLACAAVAAIGALYLVTNWGLEARPDYADYPFGADVPSYLLGDGAAHLHWLTTKVLQLHRAILSLLGAAEFGSWAKLPYALFGAATVALSIASFAIAAGRLSVRSVLYALCVGFALTIWHFASLPESYALSTLLYAAFTLGLVYIAKHGLSPRATIAMAFVFLLGLYNDISIVFLLLAPAILLGLRLVREPAGRLFVMAHGAAAGLFGLHQIIRSDFIARYLDFFFEYSPIGEATRTEARLYVFDPIAAVLNFFFYSIAAPRPELTHAPWLAYPEYRGFFDPSPLSYFSGVANAAFLALYLSLFLFIRVSRATRLILGLAAFVALRFALVVAFNPVEAILYSSVAILPFFLVLFHFLETSPFRHKTALVAALATAMFVANAQFFFA